MINTWIPAVYDRTYEDVVDLQLNPELENAKGCWNANDLNRIENNTVYCVEWMLAKKIITKAPSITTRLNFWTSNMIPDKLEINRIIGNVKLLIELSKGNPAIASELPTIYNATQINYVLANQIEYALELIHSQPRLASDYWNVTITNGIITSIIREDDTEEIINSNTALVAEEETVYISWIPKGDDAEHQAFTYWTGKPDDLELLDDTQSEATSFVMPYRDIEFTAEYVINVPRKLSVMNGYISTSLDPTAMSGPTEQEYQYGDEVMVIANIAIYGKKFNTWLSTSNLSNILTSYEEDVYPAVIRFMMPDEDLRLTAEYISAKELNVQVIGGEGSGIYAYDDEVYIRAVPEEGYVFSHWSGDTNYLTDIYSPYQTIAMPDRDVYFQACFDTVGTSCNVTMVDGLILFDGESIVQAEGLITGQTYTLVPTPPENHGIDKWIVTGDTESPGTITDKNKYKAGTGNVTITGVYNPTRKLTVLCNGDSASTSETYFQTQGYNWEVRALPAATEDRMFCRWEENGLFLSDSQILSLRAMSSDRTIVAIYGPKIVLYCTVDITNMNNLGEIEKLTYAVGSDVELVTSTETTDCILDGVYVNGNKIEAPFGRIYIPNVTKDTSIKCEYRDKITYSLTVINGIIDSTHTTTGLFKEKDAIEIRPYAPPQEDYVFIKWSIKEGKAHLSASSEISYTVIIEADTVVEAKYGKLVNITVNINETTTETFIMFSESIKTDIAVKEIPDGYTFSRWEVTSGDVVILDPYSINTSIMAKLADSSITAVYEPIVQDEFTVSIIDGYILTKDSSGETVYNTTVTLPKYSNNIIVLKQGAIPVGMVFDGWSMYSDGERITIEDEDLECQQAETTRIKNLTRNLVIKATFTSPVISSYSLAIQRKDGTIDLSTEKAETKVHIKASDPDEGKKFYKWDGDDIDNLAYAAGTSVYSDEIEIYMPSRNVTIKETYVDEEADVYYDLVMVNPYGECRVYTEGEGGWSNRCTCVEGTEIQIRLKELPEECYFDKWNAINHATKSDVRTIIDNISLTETIITMPPYDVDCEPIIAVEGNYELRVNDGGTSGMYKENAKADIYFSKTSNNDIHYEFIEWTGDNVSILELYDGGSFDETHPGTKDEPQFIRMPAESTEVTATYKTLYRLTLTNGSIGVPSGTIPTPPSGCFGIMYTGATTLSTSRAVVNATTLSEYMQKPTFLVISYNGSINSTVSFIIFDDLPAGYYYETIKYTYQGYPKYRFVFYDDLGNQLSSSALNTYHCTYIYYQFSGGAWRMAS